MVAPLQIVGMNSKQMSIIITNKTVLFMGSASLFLTSNKQPRLPFMLIYSNIYSLISIRILPREKTKPQYEKRKRARPLSFLTSLIVLTITRTFPCPHRRWGRPSLPLHLPTWYLGQSRRPGNLLFHHKQIHKLYTCTFCSFLSFVNFSTACSRILYLRIFPAAFMGNSVTKST